ncbi:MAG: hydrogenase maturation protease, partial [Deltaproteobacteria bacterium]
MERREVGEEEKARGSPRAMRNRAVIVGIGNLILKDEGVGIHVVRELAKRELPPEVKVIDGGTATID